MSSRRCSGPGGRLPRRAPVGADAVARFVLPLPLPISTLHPLQVDDTQATYLVTLLLQVSPRVTLSGTQHGPAGVVSVRSPCSSPSRPARRGSAWPARPITSGSPPTASSDRLRQRRRRPDHRGRRWAGIDTFGGGFVELALERGVKPERIDTIIDFAAAAKYGVKIDGNAAAASADVLAELAGLIDAGQLELVVAKVYPLDEVRDAYRELERRHTRGKIVLRP
jgi:Zinc-binding dehydrogenase